MWICVLVVSAKVFCKQLTQGIGFEMSIELLYNILFLFDHRFSDLLQSLAKHCRSYGGCRFWSIIHCLPYLSKMNVSVYHTLVLTSKNHSDWLTVFSSNLQHRHLCITCILKSRLLIYSRLLQFLLIFWKACCCLFWGHPCEAICFNLYNEGSIRTILYTKSQSSKSFVTLKTRNGSCEEDSIAFVLLSTFFSCEDECTLWGSGSWGTWRWTAE